VRGRRFVRPTLTLSHKGAEVRALADLEHKPWAAQDGEVWTAAFSVDEGLDGARAIELSVAPDIAVELRRKGRKLARPGDTLAAATGARSSRFKEDVIVAVPDEREQATSASQPAREPGSKSEADPAPAPRRRPSTPVELERLGARLAAANDALEQERGRRTALAKSLEEERTANRQLRTELGQARAELEVAATARAEATAVEAELDKVRAQLRDAERRHETEIQALTRRHEQTAQALTNDHEQLTDAHAALQDELRQQAQTLDLTREALAAERAETGRLHNRLSQLQQSRERGDAPPGGAGAPALAQGGLGGSSGSSGPRRSGALGDSSSAGGAETSGRGGSAALAGAREEPRAARRTRSRAEARPGAEARPRDPGPDETQRFDVLGFDSELEPETAGRTGAVSAPRRAGPQTPDPAPSLLPAPERLRPLNPSLRHRTWWFARLLALIVLCGVIVAVYLVLHTTVLH
jgi:hypothetical protein